jgi:hypothetical protein
MATSKAKAVKDEAEDKPKVKTVEFKGVTFDVSLDPMDWGYDTMDALNDNRLAAAIDGMLGPDNARKFKGLRPTLREAVDVLNQISADAGADDAGN